MSHVPSAGSERVKPSVVDSEDCVKHEWVALIKEYPTRFMVGAGTDNLKISFEKMRR
jgi:hypothetical protein